MAFKFAVAFAFLGIACTNVAAFTLISTEQPLNNTASAIPVVQPLVYRNSAPLTSNDPLIVNLAPLAYSKDAAALISIPESEAHIAKSVFKPIPNITYSSIPTHTTSYAAPYVIGN